MAIRGTVTIKGMTALVRKLEALPAKVARKALSQSLRSGAKVILAQAKANAPVDTGLLRKSLKVRAMTRMRKGTVGFKVQTAAGDFKGEEYYASFIEFGYRRGKRKRAKGTTDNRPMVPANPFMRKAFDTKKDEAVAVFGRELGQKIEDAAR